MIGVGVGGCSRVVICRKGGWWQVVVVVVVVPRWWVNGAVLDIELEGSFELRGPLLLLAGGSADLEGSSGEDLQLGIEVPFVSEEG